ncbi:ankyrin repeat domain-containing protein [Sulfuricurvum sp.]|uniref:ankyrin repeat domain-containing protein n=1 Tax=Sulfuricurvum sp. TaxID=2025608 RepID=UPI002639D9F3|nr:ankyrin repeat domain-containing protein [Sulfuricurvum sp.]MDD3596666.1 ankyrin repeat domain-containing protein [Sulfuricurvum sp.]
MTRTLAIARNGSILEKTRLWAEKKISYDRSPTVGYRSSRNSQTTFAIAALAGGSYGGYKFQLDKAIVTASFAVTQKMKELFGKIAGQVNFGVEDSYSFYELHDRLSYASYEGDLEMMKKYLEMGADVHQWGDEALYRACESGRLEAVKFLLEIGADPKARNGRALEAAERGQHGIIAQMLRSNVDPQAKSVSEPVNSLADTVRMNHIYESITSGHRFDPETGSKWEPDPIKQMEKEGFSVSQISSWKNGPKQPSAEDQIKAIAETAKSSSTLRDAVSSLMSKKPTLSPGQS